MKKIKVYILINLNFLMLKNSHGKKINNSRALSTIQLYQYQSIFCAFKLILFFILKSYSIFLI